MTDTKTQSSTSVNQARSTGGKVGKYLAWSFLGSVVFVLILILLAGSTLGLRLLAQTANQYELISVEGVSGSIYSKVSLKDIQIDLNEGAKIEIQDVEVDTKLSCLIDFAVCLDSIAATDIKFILYTDVARPKAADEQSEKVYVKLPLPVSIESVEIGRFSMVRKLKADEGDEEFVVEILSTLLEGFTARDEFTLKRLNIDEIALFDLTDVNDNAATEYDGQTDFSLARIKEVLSTAPSVKLPDIFIPVNANIQQAKANNLCWAQAQSASGASLQTQTETESFANCARNVLLKADIREQLLESHLSAQLDAVLPAYGVQAQRLSLDIELDVEQDFEHSLEVQVIKDADIDSSGAVVEPAQALVLTANGNVNSTEVSALINDSMSSPAVNSPPNSVLARVNIQSQWDTPQLPLTVNAKADSLAGLTPFLQAPFLTTLANMNVSIDGDWSGYAASIDVKVLSEAMQNAGLSTITFAGEVSPQDTRIEIKSLSTSGELGVFDLTGKVVMEPTQNVPTLMAIHSKINAQFDKLNVGMLPILRDTPVDIAASGKENHAPSSNISGDFTLNHVFTEKWMTADVDCNEIRGQIKHLDFSLGCELGLDESGLLTISELTFSQSPDSNTSDSPSQTNQINAEGSIEFANSRIEAFNTEAVLEASGDLRISADIKQPQVLVPDLNGQLMLNADINGALSRPDVVLDAKLNDIIYSGTSSEALSMNSAIVKLATRAEENFDTRASMDLVNLQLAEVLVDSAKLRLNGDLSDHELSVSINSEHGATRQVMTGEMQVENSKDWQWIGRWVQGKFDFPFVSLNLKKEVKQVERKLDSAPSADGGVLIRLASDQQNNQSVLSASVGDHCWLSEKDDTLCISALKYDASQKVQANANFDMDFEIASIARHFMPDAVLPETMIPLATQAQIVLHADNGLSASANNQIIGGRVDTPNHMLELNAIIANMSLDESVLSSVIYAGTQETGILGLQSSLDLTPGKRVHEGKVRLSGFDLSLLRRFIPSIEKIQGEVNADIGFEGELMRPMLNGELSVDSGELTVDAYTYALTDFQHDMTFSGDAAQMTGLFQLGDGAANYNAELNFAEGFAIKGELKGEGMQFAFNDSVAKVSPDLFFDLSPGDLTLKGVVAIPEAEIKVNELPESARTPSSDTIIIGAPPPEPVVPVAMDIDLNVKIDQQERGFVSVDALGLEATLAGDLQLKVSQKRSKDSDEFQPLRTTLNGQVKVLNGSYEAYGQMLVVQSGSVFFNGEPSLPQFNIRAIRNPLNTEGDVIAGLHVTGNPVVPRAELFSEPPMSQAQQLSYLMQGRDITVDRESGQSQSDAALVNALVSFGVGRSDNRIGQFGRAIGFDSLNLQTAGTGENSQVQISGRIAQDIQITYGIGVFDQASEIILKYQILPQLFIEAKSGTDSAVDLFYEISRGEFLKTLD
ncbi:translocation/assembly module TamB domain-containing protein [Ningiella sp. W23]|uniref:translocation/assembly module TamB domain-containing protein n=1 Tax=Ningiella sp. W23 TaxID=3023715 RepID=UPI0037578171